MINKEIVLYKGDIIIYIDIENKEKKGILVANNSCLYFSQAFQVIPISIKNNKIEWDAKREEMIDRNAIISVIGKINMKLFNKIEQDILNHHLSINDKYFFGDIYLANIPREYKNQQCGLRPVIIVSGEVIDDKILIIPLTTKLKKKELPTHLFLSSTNSFISKDSMILGEAEMSVKTACLLYKLGELDDNIKEDLLEIIKIQHKIKAS